MEHENVPNIVDSFSESDIEIYILLVALMKI